jgi:hypothetical protein
MKFYSVEDKAKFVEIIGMTKKQASRAITSFMKENPDRTRQAIVATIYDMRKRLKAGRSVAAVTPKKDKVPVVKMTKSPKMLGKVFGANGTGAFSWVVDPSSLHIVSENGISYFRGQFKMI